MTRTCVDIARQSLEQPDVFWRAEAARIDWHKPFDRVLDDSRLPFASWFVGGETNLCHNAVDRWAAIQPDLPALIHISTETGAEQTWTWAELLRDVQVMAAGLLSLGVEQGDRVVVYMPMVPHAVIAMLACARIGAIHSVVFGGFASVSLASRLEDAQPRVVICGEAGSRNGQVVPYKRLLDQAIELSTFKPERVVVVDRGLAPWDRVPERDVPYAELAQRHAGATVPVTWLPSDAPSYILYTSGTTGKPKGVQRDTGGYAVALASSMHGIYRGKPGEVFFSTSDIGWVVGHSYIVYGPLIAGMATIVYEGTPIRPDGGILWKIVEQYRVSVMFSAPTAIRVLRKQDPALLQRYDTGSLRALFLAGEPLDEPTGRWIAEGLGCPIIDNYWQTETGWPILTVGNGYDGVDQEMAPRFGSPGVATPGFDVQLLDEVTGLPVGPGEKGVLAIAAPLPPGCMQTIWRDDARFLKTYFGAIPVAEGGRQMYSTFDWGRQDADGYFYILGRTDDVINVAGHRLGTRELEEVIAGHPAVAEVAVVGVADELRGQVAVATVVVRQPDQVADPAARMALEKALMQRVAEQLGAVARPARVVIVPVLPKTRSGKVLRRSIQAVCEARDPGDLTTIEDEGALRHLAEALKG